LITHATDFESGDNEASNDTVEDQFLPLEVIARAVQSTQQLPHIVVCCVRSDNFLKIKKKTI